MTNKNIQLFVPYFRTEECLAQIRECLEKGWTGLGFKTLELEEKWKEYTGLPHAHYLNSATAGLDLAVRVLKLQHKWQDGAEIISTPLTFVSTNHAILYNNLKPVFADVDEYLCLNPQSVLEHITPKTRAVMFVGLGGNTGQLQKVEQICKEKGLSLILDAAHMSGTRYTDGSLPGKEADVIVYSYQAVKNMPTGDSGMICFKEAKNDEIVRKLSWLGINKDTLPAPADQAHISGNTMWNIWATKTTEILLWLRWAWYPCITWTEIMLTAASWLPGTMRPLKMQRTSTLSR